METTAPESKVDVSVLIPTRNRPKALSRCLESVIAQDYPVREIIIGDDASLPPASITDDSHLRSEGPHVTGRTPIRIVRSETPLGVIGMRLKLINESAAPVVVFLDDDVTLEEPDILRRLVGTLAASENRGLVAPLVIDHVNGREVCLGPVRINREIARQPVEIGTFAGAAFALRKSTLGITFPFVTSGYGHEEVEIAYRIASADRTMACDPTIVVHHHRAIHGSRHESATRFSTAVENRLLLARTYLPQPYRLVHVTFWVVRYFLMALRKGHFREYVKGLRSGLTSEVDHSFQLQENAVSYLRRSGGRLWF